MTILKKIVSLAVATILSSSSLYAQYNLDVTDSPAVVQLRTNSLYYLAACPNVGIEIQTDLGLAWQLDYIGAWWNSPSKNRFFSNYGFQTEMRYYLDDNSDQRPMKGHHIGAYLQLATYDFEFGGKGLQAKDLDRSFGIGISYGFSFPISTKWTLDCTAGIGYFQSRYVIYWPSEEEIGSLPTDKRYVAADTRMLKWYGPTKLEVSLVYNLNATNK